jgi:hypothetical protein
MIIEKKIIEEIIKKIHFLYEIHHTYGYNIYHSEKSFFPIITNNNNVESERGRKD